jgi:hypothetical protein
LGVEIEPRAGGTGGEGQDNVKPDHTGEGEGLMDAVNPDAASRA